MCISRSVNGCGCVIQLDKDHATLRNMYTDFDHFRNQPRLHYAV